MESTVFVVDDDKAVRDAIVFLFKSEHIAVEAYASAADFLQHYQQDHPGCLVLDISMPGMGGLELQQVLAEKRVRIPIIFVTGHGDVPMSVRAMKAGAVDFIEKPFDNAHLVCRVRDALKLDRRHREHEDNAASAIPAEKNSRAHVTLHSIGDAVITTDRNGRVEYLNPTAERLTGWTEAEALGQPIAEVFRIIDEVSLEPVRNLLSRCLELGQTAGLEQCRTLISRSGTEVAIENTASPIRGHTGELLGSVIVFKDVTHQRRATEELVYRAEHDPLTDLVNRREFAKRVEHAVASRKAHGTPHVVCFLDLDQFKIVNDTAGHAAGDELLRQVATLFMEHVRDRDAVARLGGDEFGILLANCPLDKALDIAESLLVELRDYRFIWGERSFQLGASVGLVEINSATDNATGCLAQADAACYTAKKLGRNRIHVAEPEGNLEARRHTQILRPTLLSNALEQESFLLYCQPIVALQGSPTDTPRQELLLRLLNAEGEVVLPSAFIPTAERRSLMAAIDRWVIRRGFEYYSQAVTATPNTEFSINLSADSVNDAKLPAFLREQLSKWEIPNGQVCFEITEAAALRNLTFTRRFMDEMKKIECRFALDHFGSNVSSFAILKKLPVDYIKIDGSLIRNILESTLDHATVAAINQIGHTMGIRTVAAWAENAATIKRLTEMGVDYAQGNALSSPRRLEHNIRITN